MKPVQWSATVLLWTAVATMTTACDVGEPTPPSNPKVLAVVRGGEITVEDLDRAILALPEAARQAPAEEARQRDRQLIEVLAVNRLLLEQADVEGVREDPEFIVAHQENLQRIVADDFIRRRLAESDPITVEASRAYFDEHREDFKQPAARLAFHIFRRVGDPDEVEPATREMEALRERVVNGESFGSLARATSDSETAERDGELGWITETNAPPDLASVIFGLDPGVPSQPVVTAEGVHLFMVTAVSTARTYDFDEVEGRIVAILDGERRRALVEQVVEELPKPDPYFVTGIDEMQHLLGGGDPSVEVFRIGRSSMTLGRFRWLVDRAVAASAGGPAPDLPANLFQALVNRARIYEHCRAEGLLEGPELADRLRRAEEDDVVDFLRERALLEEARLDGPSVEAYFETHRRRFSSPLILDARFLVVPIPDRGANRMMELLSRLDSDPSGDRLGEAAAATGGSVERVEGTTLAQIERWSPKVARVVSALETGRCSQPVRVGGSIVVVELERRSEPEPQPFAAVADEVVRSYLADHRREVYDRWSGRLLEEAGFRVFDDRLEAFRGDPGAAAGRGAASGGPD
jgi:parvulin-like peptidyl-prolyl isomerase